MRNAPGEGTMFHYSIFFSKETEGELVSLPFRFEADVGVDAAALEAEWLNAFEDPHGSWLWPSELSLPAAEGGELKTGAFFQLAYAMPDPGDLGAAPKHYTYDYSVQRFERGPMVFAYQAEHGDGRRHPFTGGGTVSVLPGADGQCRLRWEGAYRHTGNRQGAEDVFAHYFSLFFTTMAKNIRLHHAPAQAA
jgi:hypothetical protein